MPGLTAYLLVVISLRHSGELVLQIWKFTGNVGQKSDDPKMFVSIFGTDARPTLCKQPNRYEGACVENSYQPSWQFPEQPHPPFDSILYSTLLQKLPQRQRWRFRKIGAAADADTVKLAHAHCRFGGFAQHR